MLYNCLPPSINLLVFIHPLLVLKKEISKFRALDQPATFVFGAKQKRRAIGAGTGFIMLNLVGRLSPVFVVPGAIGGQCLPGRAGIRISSFIIPENGHIKSMVGRMGSYIRYGTLYRKEW